MKRIFSFFALGVFVLHFFGMQALAFVQNDHHCGTEKNITHECCEVQGVFVNGKTDFEHAPFAVLPVIFEIDFKNIFSQEIFVFTKYTDEIFPPPWLEWKNIMVMRC